MTSSAFMHFGKANWPTAAFLALRRSACALRSDGEIAMGAPFSDFTVPTVNFRLSG